MGGVKMDFGKYFFGIFFLGALFLLDYLYRNTKKLKEEMKKNYDLIDENYNLKKKIDELKDSLKDENEYLKNIVMTSKDGSYTKGELIKEILLIINEYQKRLKEIEKRERSERLQNKIKISEIFGIDVTEQKKAKDKERKN